jgi:5-methyltetrahydropteroyltriglutamate--homocysteine methyltransferase
LGFPYRADHVGSLLRPPELRAIRGDRHSSAERVREIEDLHILRALERQKQLGFQIFSDGEFRRGGFMSDFYDSVEGLDKDGSVAREWQGQRGTQGQPLKGVVVEKIRQTRRLTAHEAAFLQRHSPGDFKITLPSANQFPAIMYKKGLSDRAYGNPSEFLWDVVPVIQAEIQALAREGVKYIQIDAPRYSYYVDPKWRRYIQLEMGLDPEQALEEAIRADNACLEGANSVGAVTAIHLCRGNNRSQWYAEGGYDPIAERLFAELNVNAFLLEYESERAGSFQPLRFVPKNKTVVLGLISSKLPDLESEDELARRIEEAARFIPLENLALSPQCGFASTAEGNLLTEDQQWRKMELVVRVARKIWSGTAAP